MTARNTPKRRLDPDGDDGYEPEDDGILRIGEEVEAPRHEVLFTLAGESYDVIVNPAASLMLQYFDKIRKAGSNVAFSWLLEEMVGADGYRALLESRAVSQEDFRRVCNAVLKIVLGNQETPIPKSRTSRSRPRTG